MKESVICIFMYAVCILASCAHMDTQTAGRNPEDFERSAIKNSGIQYIKTYQYESSSGRIHGDSAFLLSAAEYNKDGYMIMKETRYNNENIKTPGKIELFFYNSANNLVEIIEKDLEGNVTKIIQNKFQGNLIAEVQYCNPDGSLDWKVVSIHDNHGNEIERIWYDSNGNVTSKSKSNYNTENELVESREYHKNGELRIISKIVYIGTYEQEWTVVDKDDEIQYKMRIKINDAGHVVEFTGFDKDGSIRSRIENDFDENGLMIERRSYHPNLTGLIWVRKLEYIQFNN